MPTKVVATAFSMVIAILGRRYLLPVACYPWSLTAHRGAYIMSAMMRGHSIFLSGMAAGCLAILAFLSVGCVTATKAMTALLAGIAVDKDQVDWETTAGELLPEGGYDVPDSYAEITLRQLLSHTSGVPALMAQEHWVKHFAPGESGPEQRRRMVKEVFELPLDFKPGSRTNYSNMGVVVAGTMLEVALGKNWETLMNTRLFEPIGMKRAGFGPPAADGSAGEPWGHAKEPVDPTAMGADNPAGFGPAGTVHASIMDLAAYVQVWLDEGRPLISRESYEVIVSKVKNNFGLGWLVFKSEDGLFITHDGSNTMFYSSIRLYPDADIGVVVTANSGGAQKAVHLLADHLLGVAR